MIWLALSCMRIVTEIRKPMSKSTEQKVEDGRNWFLGPMDEKGKLAAQILGQQVCSVGEMNEPGMSH